MEQNLENAETENENVERGSNFDIFLNISMYVKTHFVPIIQARFQTAEDLFTIASDEAKLETIASNATSNLASSTTSNLASSNGKKSVGHDFEPVEVTINTDDEEGVEGEEEDVEHDLEPDEQSEENVESEESEEISEAVEDQDLEPDEPNVDYDLEPDEPNVDQDREDDKNEAILDDIISVLASQEQEVSEDASEEEEVSDATAEASDEPTDEDIDTNADADVISDKFSPTPRRPSPYTPSQYRGRSKKPSKYQNEGESRGEDNFVKEDTHTFQAHTPKIILPKSKSRLGTEKSEMKSGSIAIKPYKPTDVLIRSLKEINYDQLEKGEYSIADLKHFATLLNIGATEKIEDLQQQILDILQQYVEE